MSSIFSCKMYNSCKNPQKILAAVQLPVNQKLVVQLKQYLGDEALALLQQAEQQSAAAAEAEVAEAVDTEDEIIDDSNDHISRGGIPHQPLAEKHADAFDEEPSESSEDASEGTSDQESAESATKLSGTKITAASVLSSAASGEILAMLNARAETAGVYRVSVKSDTAPELWIYYNDDINLNTVMPKVVDLIFASGYTTLSFNRLARSNNAIVFTYDVGASAESYHEA